MFFFLDVSDIINLLWNMSNKKAFLFYKRSIHINESGIKLMLFDKILKVFIKNHVIILSSKKVICFEWLFIEYFILFLGFFIYCSLIFNILPKRQNAYFLLFGKTERFGDLFIWTDSKLIGFVRRKLLYFFTENINSILRSLNLIFWPVQFIFMSIFRVK